MNTTAAEKTGWLLSGVLHVSLVAFAVVGLPHLGRDRPDVLPPVAVEFIKIDDVTRVVEPEREDPVENTSRQQRPAETSQAPVEIPAEQPVPAEAELVPQPTAPDPPAPKPKPKPELTETQKLSQRVVPRRKPKPPSRLQADRLAALINKEIEEEAEQVRQTEEAAAEKEAEEVRDRFASIRGRLATATLQEALRQKLERCWNIPVGAKGIENMFVKVRIWLRADGTLSRQPEFVSSLDMNDPFVRTFAESARTAVFRCAPFTEAQDYIQNGNPYIDFDFDGSGFAG